MTYPARVLGFREDGEIEALDSDQFAMLSDVEMTIGPTTPGLLSAVYESAAGIVDKALATPATTPCIGIVSALLPLGKCLVRKDGKLAGFIGLTPGKTYFVDDVVPGGIVAVAPTAPGTVSQEVGMAIAADTLLLGEIDWIENN